MWQVIICCYVIYSTNSMSETSYSSWSANQRVEEVEEIEIEEVEEMKEMMIWWLKNMLSIGLMNSWVMFQWICSIKKAEEKESKYE